MTTAPTIHKERPLTGELCTPLLELLEHDVEDEQKPFRTIYAKKINGAFAPDSPAYITTCPRQFPDPDFLVFTDCVCAQTYMDHCRHWFLSRLPRWLFARSLQRLDIRKSALLLISLVNRCGSYQSYGE